MCPFTANRQLHFCGTVIVSWLSILLYQRIPFALRLIFTRSHRAAAE